MFTVLLMRELQQNALRVQQHQLSLQRIYLTHRVLDPKADQHCTQQPITWGWCTALLDGRFPQVFTRCSFQTFTVFAFSLSVPQQCRSSATQL
jgi:hypothetical protein